MLVAEIGERTGAAVCGSLLAELGAEVVLIEPGAPDVDAANLSCKWNWRNRVAAGKRSVTREQFDGLSLGELLECADVVITSSDWIAGARPGLRWSVPERQIVCDITAWGNSGPRSGERADELQMQAATGILATTGHEGGPPLPVRVPLIETLTGLQAAGAVLTAHRLVERGGPGQRIDMALYDCGFAAMSSFFSRLLVEPGAQAGARRLGSRHTLSAPWNVYRARDGWLLICTGSDLQWQRLCELMQRPALASDSRYRTSVDRVRHVVEIDGEVQAWVGTQTVADCVQALASVSIAGGAITRIDGYPREANLEFRSMVRRLETADGAPLSFAPASSLRMSGTPGRALTRVPERGSDRAWVAAHIAQRRTARTSTVPRATDRPLRGLRVVEIGHYTTAPICTRQFAAFGAEVVKVEPPEGEASRAWPPIDRGQSMYFTISNTDKRSLVLDLGNGEERRVLESLLAESDVLVENLKPGALARQGLSPQRIAQINPRLIYCAISGFGSESLYAGRPAFDTVVQGMSGLMDLLGGDGPPVKTGISTADVMGASMAYLAILAALAHRERSGQGQFIDLSMQDIVAWSTQVAWDGIDPVVGRDIDAAALEPADVLRAPQTLARQLCVQAADERGAWSVLAVPLRLQATPPLVRRPGPALARSHAGDGAAAPHEQTISTNRTESR